MWDILSRLFGTFERPSPNDIIPRDSIVVGNTFVKIKLSNPSIPFSLPPRVWIPEIPDSNSMDGVFDLGNNNILIAGANDSDQQLMVDFITVGDVAVYRIPSDWTLPTKIYAIHRVVEIGYDGSRYFKFRGDNNPGKDPYKCRDENILWLSIGTIY